MTSDADHDRFRLALLLAGGGRRARMVVAGAGGSIPNELDTAALPPTLLRAAERLMKADVPSLLDRLAASGWRWTTPRDPAFPADLARVVDPPLGLFVRGSLRSWPAVAIVGSRRASAYGLQVARLLATELAREEVVIVSGMARGVDRAAHEGAVDAGGQTWAVWGAGPDRVYPAEHGRLAERIAASGALITEYPPGTPPRRHHFPERNRLIAGLSRAVVVVEAAARSGALVTAGLALDEGREVLAVPGSVLSELSVGPNALLRLGARPAVTPRDVLEALGLEARTQTAPVSAAGPGEPLLEALAPGEVIGIDELALRVGWSVDRVTARAVELELEGALIRGDGGEYRRRDVRAPRGPE